MKPYRDAFAKIRPAGGFTFIMADPPWRFEYFNQETGAERGPDAHYETMELEEIMAMPVEMLAAKDCLLWLWCTHPNVPQAMKVMDAWGFSWTTSGCWSKRNPETGKLAFGTGHVLRCASEPFLIGSRGRPRTSRKVRTLIEGRRREHSRKPDEAYAAAELLMPGARRLDMFSRQARPGWTNWGNEANKFTSRTQVEGSYAAANKLFNLEYGP